MCSAWCVSVSVGMCGPCASVAPVGMITAFFAAIGVGDLHLRHERHAVFHRLSPPAARHCVHSQYVDMSI